MTNIFRLAVFVSFISINSFAQNVLNIPPALTGTSFNLNIQSGSQVFYTGTTTPTYGINGPWMSPTIIVNRGDSVTLNVINHLPVKTTMHWHGLHVAPQNDGGPNQIINPGTTWSPTFKIRNNASTYWYHPHGAGQTDPQVSKGLAGILIVHDSAELALNIPHTYGIDDVPLIIQTKAFDVLQQIAIATDMDTAIFVNGTLNPYYNTPAQVIRFRLLNGSSMRSYDLGLSNGQIIYQIGTDGGLLDTPIALTRLLLSPGERAEILINFSAMTGQTVYLKSFASELPTGIYGAHTIGSGRDTIPEYTTNLLNGTDFNLLKLKIVAATSSPVTSIPPYLVPLIPYLPSAATNTRTIVLDTIRLLPGEIPNRAEGPFGMNNRSFDMDTINETVYLNTTEIWTIKNNTLIAHPFHIHNVQFNIIEEHGIALPAKKRGWKDVLLVMPMDSIKFLTRFETFANPAIPYMYHCHLLHHEDDGMMGQFVVMDGSTSTQEINNKPDDLIIYPNPTSGLLNIQTKKVLANNNIINIYNTTGQLIYTAKLTNTCTVNTSGWNKGIYNVVYMGSGECNHKTFIVE
ncbi:MAG: multicopper oxidase domain-containing protein [Taibaiella sp.]|nr:multicopper oxidase domain-containing protein [Taibaiella sp.]